jgi:hypothetical protein
LIQKRKVIPSGFYIYGCIQPIWSAVFFQAHIGRIFDSSDLLVDFVLKHCFEGLGIKSLDLPRPWDDTNFPILPDCMPFGASYFVRKKLHLHKSKYFLTKLGISNKGIMK